MLDGFDYATYLKKRLLVGQVDPWRRTEKGKPIWFTHRYGCCYSRVPRMGWTRHP